jgi:hypothetical protein
MSEIDRCIGRMNQFLDKVYLKFNLIIATTSEQRKLQIERFMDNSLKRIKNENSKLFQKCDDGSGQIITYFLAINKYKYEKAMPYLNEIKVRNMDIEQYLEHNYNKGNNT